MYIGVKQAFDPAPKDPGDWNPISLSETVSSGNAIQLTPSNSLLLFFDTGLKTSMIFEGPVLRAVEVPFSEDRPCIKCLYNDRGQWIVKGVARPKLGYKSERDFYSEKKKHL